MKNSYIFRWSHRNGPKTHVFVLSYPIIELDHHVLIVMDLWFQSYSPHNQILSGRAGPSRICHGPSGLQLVVAYNIVILLNRFRLH